MSIGAIEVFSVPVTAGRVQALIGRWRSLSAQTGRRSPGQHFWQEPGGYGNLIFATEDIDSAYQELSSRGVEFAGSTDQDGTQFLLFERDN